MALSDQTARTDTAQKWKEPGFGPEGGMQTCQKVDARRRPHAMERGVKTAISMGAGSED